MADGKTLSVKDLVLKQAEQINVLTLAISAQNAKLEELQAQKVKTSKKKRQIEVTGTDDVAVIKFVKSIYERSAGKKNAAYDRIKSIKVNGVEFTPSGHKRIEISKTLNNGEVKSHPLMMWRKK